MTNGMTYENPKNVSKPTRESLRNSQNKMLSQAINDCSTARVLMCVARKHASGLKTFAIFLMGSYIVWDKIKIFF